MAVIDGEISDAAVAFGDYTFRLVADGAESSLIRGHRGILPWR
jgi:hypothetical protein